MYGAQGRRGSGPEWGKLRPEPDLQNFLDKQELSALDKPILFEQHESFGSYLCFNGLVQMLAGCIVCPVIMQPIQTLCGSSLASSFGLELHKDSIHMRSANNDCCCHIADNAKTVGLDKVQDVQLVEHWCLTCFNLKQVNVETAAQGGGASEIVAVWLAEPALARDAIQLAVRLHKTAAAAPPAAQEAMSRAAEPQPAAAPPPAIGAGSTGSSAALGVIESRLGTLAGLVERGALSVEEAARVRLGVLVSEHDVMLTRLVDAANSVDRELISREEFDQVKAAIVAQLARAAAV